MAWLKLLSEQAATMQGALVEIGQGASVAEVAKCFTRAHKERVEEVLDTEAFVPKSQVFVTMNVFVTGLASGDSATLGSFVQRLAQTGAPGKAGDYNQSDVVDAADYTVWRDHLGASAGTLPNDANGGVIGVAQYNTWKANFGMAGSAALGATAVPEPGLLNLLAVAACSVPRWRSGRLRRSVRKRTGGGQWHPNHSTFTGSTR